MPAPEPDQATPLVALCHRMRDTAAMSREPRPLSEEQDAHIADRLARLWESYRADDAATGAALGEELVREFADHGEAWFWLGCCRERLGQLRAADRAFLRANRARLEPQAGPYRVAWRHFQQAVDTAADSLPPQLRAALEEITLVLADHAEPALLEGHDEPELLGLFDGVERSERDGSGPCPSPRIYLFRRAHEHLCASRSEFDAEVRQTLWHELGHYLGYGEEELEALGRG